MLPFSIMTFWSFTHAPSTPLSVLVARVTAWLMASSKPVSEVALNSVTRAILIRICASLHSSFRDLAACLICGRTERKPNIKARAPRTSARGLRGAAVGAIPLRLPPQRLLLCGPSLTSSPDGFPPPGMVTERPAPRRTGVSHLAQRRVLILRADCYNAVKREPTVGNDFLGPGAASGGEGGH